MRRPARFLTTAMLSGVLCLTASTNAAQTDFVRDIRPILSDRCFICHGPDALARKSDLRLDSFEGATADLGGYAAVVPGKPEESELLRRVRHESERRRMPLAESKLTLTEDEIRTLERWIAEGGRYEKHWAFVPPRNPEVPAVDQEDWPRDELDRLVLARLQAEGLEPAPEAARGTWLRRVSFGLTGLPPTLDELDGFLADTSASAHERVVDRLLASPRYGERMASDWLDAARYADSYGYQNDVHRDVWPWRDWVVQAFNQDLGWDRFATWQLAGDLLPQATRDQRLATAFNRLHRQTNEGGSVEEEYRVEYVSDRVHTFGTAFLGLTFECARCHDHKYDPILQSEYYALSAFFDNIDESGLYSHFTNAVPTPTLLLASEADEQQIEALRTQVESAEQALSRALGERGAAYDARPTEFSSNAPIPDHIGAFEFESSGEGGLLNEVDSEHPGTLSGNPEFVAGRHGQGLLLDGENNAHFNGLGDFTRDDPFTIALWIRAPEIAHRAVIFHRSRAWTDSGSRGYQLLIEDGELSAALIHFWPGNAIRIRTQKPLPTQRWVHVAVTYDGSSRADGLAIFVDGVHAETRTVRDNLTRKTLAGSTSLTLGQRFRDVGFAGGSVDSLQLFARRLCDVEIRHLVTGESLESLLNSSPKDARAFYLGAISEEVGTRRDELRDARHELSMYLDGVAEIMTMTELDTPRPTHRLVRGSYLDQAERVQPGTPAQIAPFSNDLPPNRLGLARWLHAPENPLFARVAVNRLWRIAFGKGLVSSAENFGSQGVPPEHPELLDYLSLELPAADWSIKQMMRRLVLSATYRQSSRGQPDPDDKNAGNRLLAHGPRLRLPAEMIRDQALFVSGLLVERLGGPPVMPYQPPGLWQEKNGRVYAHDEGDGLWRRSLYTFWKRTSPPPAMMIFDAVKRDVCVAQRQSTSSPLQALALWNDPQLVEAARALGELLANDVQASDEQRLKRAFRLVTSRQPSAEELDVLVDLLWAARGKFGASPGDAAQLLAIGSSPRDHSLDSVEAASLTIVANMLLSYDGAVTLR